ncbi:MAG: hypothetical protein JST47_16105 [Bacteroidetes bacterium]|nr:hypothetical protein [Bacteroidota bacterium]MBS1973506.1 hypothetical protein [Bacteroidota bacterium]
MITNAVKISVPLLAIALLASCSPRMAGTWRVERFETTQPGQTGVALRNIGTIQFYKNGSGIKNISYAALGVTHNDQNAFKWTWSDGKYVTIEGNNSDFSKTWIIMTNKKKYQKWKSTDGTNNIQILELKK